MFHSRSNRNISIAELEEEEVKMRRMLSEYVKKGSATYRTRGICSVLSSHNSHSSFTANPFVNCSEVLHWLFSANRATIALVKATVAA